MVGIPVMFDQRLNMRIAEQKGYGIRVPLEDLSMENLKLAINKVLGNARLVFFFKLSPINEGDSTIHYLFIIIFSYDVNVKLTSDRYRDLLKNPLETGVFWVEHVAKNKGAPHLRSVAVNLTIYQLYNLDCWAVVIIGLLTTIFILYKLFQAVISFFFSYLEIIKLKKA